MVAVRACSIWPERMRTTRSQRRASDGSCVTSTSVVPCSMCPANRRSMIWRPVSSSRLPVGSSATKNCGTRRERARERDPLLLAAGQFRRIMCTPLGQVRPQRARARRARTRPRHRQARAARRRFRSPSWSGSGERIETRCRCGGRETAPAHPHRACRCLRRRSRPSRCRRARARPSPSAGSISPSPMGRRDRRLRRAGWSA